MYTTTTIKFYTEELPNFINLKKEENQEEKVTKSWESLGLPKVQFAPSQSALNKILEYSKK